MEDIKGCTEARIFTKPLRELTEATSLGFNAVRFAEQVLGMDLLPWQKWFLIGALELAENGSLRFRTVVLLVARQNGKSHIMTVAALYRMFTGVDLVVSTAQNLDIAEEVFQGGLDMVESIPAVAARLEKVSRTNGKKFFGLDNGARWKVASASRQGGRGLSAGLVLMDELREHQSYEAWQAVSSTTLAKANAQVWGVSNAGDSKSVVLRELRDSATLAIDSPDTELGIFEWSAAPECDIDDINGWAQANPSLGYTLPLRALRAVRQSSSENGFRTENLCQWVDILAPGPWADGVWAGLTDANSSIAPGSEITVSVDVSHDRQMAYIALAGWREDERAHVEIVEQRAGSDWVVPFLTENFAKIPGATQIVIQGAGAPASSLVELLQLAGLPVFPIQGSNLGPSCGLFSDAVERGAVRHLPQPVLDQAAEVAVKKPLNDIWVWNRAASPVDIAPLVAASQAFWALTTSESRRPALLTSIYETESVAWA